MAEGTTDTTTTATTTAATTTAAAPWYDGKLDAELLGHAQNKGWKVDDPAATAVEAIKAHRELQKHFGVPADQLLKLPKDAGDDKGWSDVYARLGVPKEAKDYDLAAIKHADGSEMSQALADALRAGALAARVPKDRIGEYAKPVVKHFDDLAAAAKAAASTALDAERTKLAQNWGTTPDKLKDSTQMALAKIGAQRLGISPEGVQALEKQVGYAAVMEAMRKIGAGTNEDTFHEGGGKGGSGAPMTRAGAVARLAELQGDDGWRGRLLSGGTVEKQEFENLTRLIAQAA
jgi:hypothetical protein